MLSIARDRVEGSAINHISIVLRDVSRSRCGVFSNLIIVICLCSGHRCPRACSRVISDHITTATEPYQRYVISLFTVVKCKLLTLSVRTRILITGLYWWNLNKVLDNNPLWQTPYRIVTPPLKSAHYTVVKLNCAASLAVKIDPRPFLDVAQRSRTFCEGGLLLVTGYFAPHPDIYSPDWASSVAADRWARRQQHYYYYYHYYYYAAYLW